MELISVMIPVYNAERYLDRCVESVVNQTHSRLEIILVDDGSPDACPRFCQEWQARDPRIRVIHQENRGLGLARNAGLELARGTYAAFLDADDWISPSHIANLYAAAEIHRADVVLGSFTGVSADGRMQAHPLELEEKCYQGQEIVDQLLLPMIAPGEEQRQDVQIESSACMNLYRMDVLRTYDIQFISERYSVGEDLHFNVDVLHHADRAAVTRETGYFYRENPNSLTRAYDPRRFSRTVNFYHALRERLETYGYGDFGFQLSRCYLMKLRVAIRLTVGSDLPRREKLREIEKMLSHDLTARLLAGYPVETCTPAMALLVRRMRAGDARGVYRLMGLREWARRGKFRRWLVRQLGIGKR